MWKKPACALLIVFAVLSQSAYAMETVDAGAGNQGQSKGPGQGPGAEPSPVAQELSPAAPAGSPAREPAGVGGEGQDRAGEGEAAGSAAPEAAAPAQEVSEESARGDLPERKDPFVAGVFSWFMMGVGQIYCREYRKGSLFIAADLLDKVALLLLVSHVNNQYAPESGTATINWSSFNGETKFLVVSYLVVSLGLRFYSVADAVQSAKKYNEMMSSRSERGGLSFSSDGDRYSLQYSIPLHD